MTMIELLEILGIQEKTLRIQKHPKMIQLLKACNQQDISLYEHNFVIQEEAFLVLLETIHSIKTLVNILKRADVLLNINDTPKEIALFYNLYSPEVLQYSEYSKILMDEEYLRYATKEWTETIFLKNDKVLSISNKEIFLKENPNQPDEDDYIESFLYNLVALKKAKELHLLKEAIQKLQE